jgi:two-component system, cell cycle response regulator CpdR
MARILLADDDAATRALVERALAVDGHVVTSTQDGAEALERLKAPGAFDVLISDVQMPAVDGIALAEKGLAAQPNLRVILISGFSDEIDRARHLKKSKVARVIAKPITLEGIRAAVKAALA